MAGREAFQRFAQQLTQQSRARGGGGGGGGPSGGQVWGGGLGLFTIIGGGLLLNSSLFNGSPLAPLCVRYESSLNLASFFSRWWTPCHQV